jgi:tetratricopeptide (TPR) repeat protein
MRALLLSLSFALLTACGGGQDETANLSEEAKAEFLAIKDVYRERNFEEASASLDSFLKANPEHAVGWILIGNARREMGLMISAKEAYRKAIAIDPLRMEAFLGLGVVARKAGSAAARKGDKREAQAQLKAAETHYERALSIEPFNAATLSSMAMLQIHLNQPKKALRNAEKAWELTKRDATIAANLAIAYHHNVMIGKRDEARDSAERLGYRGVDKLNALFAK